DRCVYWLAVDQSAHQQLEPGLVCAGFIQGDSDPDDQLRPAVRIRGSLVEANNNMANFDITSGNILLADKAGASRSLVNSRKDQYSPRLGFALALDPKTVL